MCKLVSCKQAILSHTIAKRERNTLCEFAQSTVRHSSPSSSQGKPMPTYSNFAVRDLLLRPGKGCARRRASQSISAPKLFAWTTHACIAWNVVCECLIQQAALSRLQTARRSSASSTDVQGWGPSLGISSSERRFSFLS